jgi:Ni,Fe-hydrogenase I cytochrome b subunit
MNLDCNSLSVLILTPFRTFIFKFNNKKFWMIAFYFIITFKMILGGFGFYTQSNPYMFMAKIHSFVAN